MGRIPEEQINELKERLDIVDIISGYVDLKRAGSNFKGLCPFHNEKTPSFMVSREKNNFHCFGCHEGGDTISFIMKIENLNYIEAIRFLADKIGMVLDETEYSREKVERNNKFYEINSLAARYYFKNLLIEDLPQKYLENKGFDKRILNKYFIGYAKNDNGLYHFLKENKFEEEDMVKLGLIGLGNNGYYDKFRDRLMFPILNNRNKVIGFGGRTLIDHKIKYINSPESEIFTKGKNIYGVNVINRSRNRNQVILVEGYMDVIALYNQGIDYAVATLGTALTEDQAKLIRRYGSQIYIAYDGDEAGVKATLRAIDIFKNMDVQLAVLAFPDDMDPDEYISHYGKEKFEKLMKKATEPIDFKLQKLSEKTDNRIEFINEIIDFLADIEGNVIRDIYIDKSAKFIGVTTESIRADVNKKIEEISKRESYRKSNNIDNRQYGYNNSKLKSYQKPIDAEHEVIDRNQQAINRRVLLEKELLICSLIDEDSYQSLSELSLFLQNEKHKEFYKLISNYYNKKTNIESILESDVSKSLNILKEYENIDLYKNSPESIIDELKNRINYYNLEQKRDKILELIRNNNAKPEDLVEYTKVIQQLSGDIDINN